MMQSVRRRRSRSEMPSTGGTSSVEGSPTPESLMNKRAHEANSSGDMSIGGEGDLSARLAGMAKINESLMSRLSDKDKEISSLRQRLAQYEAREEAHRRAASPTLTTPHLKEGHSASIDFGAVGSNTVQLLTAARNSTQHRSMASATASDTNADNSLPNENKSGALNSTISGFSSSLEEMEPIHTTDTDTIRRRYTALEKGPKSMKEPMFTDYKSLFKPNLIIEFGQDTPSFRRKVETLDQNVEGLRGHLQQLVTIARKYCESGNTFCAHGKELSSALMHLQGEKESWFQRLGDLSPALIRFGETLDEIQNYNEQLLLSLETTFSAPMEEFVRREVKFIRKMKAEVNRASEDYETHLSKFLQLKNSTDGAQVQVRSAEVAKTRRHFELSRFDLVHHLNQLETKKKFQLVERVCSALYAFLGYFHQCHSLVASVEPSMRDLQHALHLARKDLALDDRLWNAKRMQLELALSSGLSIDGAVFAASNHGHSANSTQMMPGGGTGTFNNTGGASPTSELSHSGQLHRRSNTLSNLIGNANLQSTPDLSDHADANANNEVIDKDDIFSSDDEGDESEEPLSAASSVAPPLPPGEPVKSGYLWKRSTNVRRDWKRRFFCIQGGKLYYVRQEAMVSPPVPVCDIQLCTVRSCDRDTDQRFCFEIISPKMRTYLLQAEDELSHQQWVDAIRGEIEHLLSTGGEGRRFSTVGANDRSSARKQVLGADGNTTGGLAVSHLTQLSKANPACVDCGSPSPDWASINLGIMMCIECSGIHRSMGVHISKVRSLTLDRWSISLLQLMEAVGNRNFNAVWEGDMTGAPPRPEPNSDRTMRELFIRRKYCQRAFVGTKLTQEEADKVLYASALNGDMNCIQIALANNADVNWANDSEKNCTAAHQAARGGQVAIMELLSQNGCNLDALNSEDVAPLDVAMQEANQDMIALLVTKLERDQNSTALMSSTGLQVEKGT